MKRQRRMWRVIGPAVENGKIIYHDKTIIAMVGGKKPIIIMRRIVHGTYRQIAVMTSEAYDSGATVPEHDEVYVNPAEWEYHFLKRIR